MEALGKFGLAEQILKNAIEQFDASKREYNELISVLNAQGKTAEAVKYEMEKVDNLAGKK